MTNTNTRLCLRELHLLNQEDYKSLVLVVFNKFVNPEFVLIKVSHSHPTNTNAVPPRTRRIPWCMGSRRLLLPSIPLRFKSTPSSPSHTSQIHPRCRNSRVFLTKVHVPRLHCSNQRGQN